MKFHGNCSPEEKIHHLCPPFPLPFEPSIQLSYTSNSYHFFQVSSNSHNRVYPLEYTIANHHLIFSILAQEYFLVVGSGSKLVRDRSQIIVLRCSPNGRMVRVVRIFLCFVGQLAIQHWPTWCNGYGPCHVRICPGSYVSDAVVLAEQP